MSAKTNIYLSLGVLTMIVIWFALGLYYLKAVNDQIIETKRLTIESREIANVRGNQTLGAVGESLLETKEIQKVIEQNLTAHIKVTNDTNKKLNELIEHFNQTNEIGRAKAVDEIIQAVNNNTKLLEELINENKISIEPDIERGYTVSDY